MERRLILIVGIVICLGASIGCQAPAALSETEQTAIRQADQNWAKLMNARDFNGVAALYAEDAIVLPPNEPTVEGRAAIQTWLEALPPISNVQLQTLEIAGRGDLAYSRGTYSETITPAGAVPVEDRGKWLTIYSKQADGSWKIVRDVFNFDLPLPALEKAAEPAKK